MAPPGNGIFVVRGELSTLMTAMRRGARWNNSNSYQDENQSLLMRPLYDLKVRLNQTEDLRLIDPNEFLAPFLDIIKSEETTGPATSIALSAVNKFLSYGLIDPTHGEITQTMQNIAYAVTHARFVGTDQASDAVVLMKIVQVLSTIMLSPEGSSLTNEMLCEVMLSCFRICFEPRLNEILRRSAEQALRDMVLLLFMRLPQFVDEMQPLDLAKKLKMVANDPAAGAKRRKAKPKPSGGHSAVGGDPQVTVTAAQSESGCVEPTSPNMQLSGDTLGTLRAPTLSTTPLTPAGNIVDMRGKFIETPNSSKNVVSPSAVTGEQCAVDGAENEADVEDEGIEESIASTIPEDELRSTAIKAPNTKDEYVNSVGVRFTQQSSRVAGNNSSGELVAYGLPCIRELLRFLVTLCNPMDKQNTDVMIHMGLNLLTVALEVGADSIGKYEALMSIVRDDMCRNLFVLLNSERLSIFAADLQLCFLMFESLRGHLKFQLAKYLTALSEIVASESPKISYETRELALENVLQLWRIPGFATELYINYDCNLYCNNVFEDLTKLLSKNALSATQSIFTTHILSLDALVTVIELIGKNCTATQKGALAAIGSRHSRNNSSVDRIVLDMDTTQHTCSGNDSSTTIEVENINSVLGTSASISRGHHHLKSNSSDGFLTPEQITDLKNKKRILSQGTELFNNRAEKGIQYLQENGMLNPVLDPREVADFLRNNPGLDKNQIGEYVSKRKSVENKILEHFVKSFDFSNLRIDSALRMYLETFRLPGEAPLISLVMEHFSDHWHILNGEPFAHVDAAFGLAYAVIMLNMDQHNHNVKKMNIPMTVDDFTKNLRGMNGKADFNPKMLVEIYNAIKNDEIVMPAEQTGTIRESYLWKVLLRRGATAEGQFHHVSGAMYDKEIFNVVWGPTLAALSFMFDKSPDQMIGQKAVNGFNVSATIASNYNLTSEFDALILTLCKFTGIPNASKEMNEIQMAVALGLNQKAQVAAKTVFGLVQRYGDSMREGWKNIVEVLGQLFKLKLLPRSLVEIEDFCKPNGKYILMPERVQVQRPEAAGLFSSLYSYLSSDNQRQPSYEEQEIIKVARKCIKECRIDQIIQESKFLHVDSLQEFLHSLDSYLKPPASHKAPAGATRVYEEDMVLFMLEMYVRVLIQNKDRLLPIWDQSKEPLYRLLFNEGKSFGYDQLVIRTTVSIFKLSALLMRSEELCPVVLQSLKTFLRFKSATVLKLSRAISIGMYELLKTSAQHIHTEADWAIVFTILECVGAGAANKEFEQWLAAEEAAAAAAAASHVMAKSDGALSSEEDSGVADRGYTSDSELMRTTSPTSAATSSPTAENWIIVTADADVQNSPVRQPQGNYLAFPCKLSEHSPFALVKCWDSVAFIVRNVAHITPYNFEGCVRCIRTFVEASLSGPRAMRAEINGAGGVKKQDKRSTGAGSTSAGEDLSTDGESDCEDLTDRYPTIAIQFLDIMHTLHTRTANIFLWWAEEGGAMPQGSTLWSQAWCPLLQGMARLATDQRRNVRTGAITCLQRALLAHDLQTLSGSEWEGCFRQVLFPLLSNLLAEQVPNSDPSLMEESRMRTATIMSKVFLHHLTPLLGLNEFANLWLEILEYLERFMRIGSDMLYEAMLEGLKNMLLVMHSVRVFHNADGVTHSMMWDVTWRKIDTFQPNLKADLFKGEEEKQQAGAAAVQEAAIAVMEQQKQQQQSMPEVGFYPPAVEQEVRTEIVAPELSGYQSATESAYPSPQTASPTPPMMQSWEQYPVSGGIPILVQDQNPIYNNYQTEFHQSPMAGYPMMVTPEQQQQQQQYNRQEQLMYPPHQPHIQLMSNPSTPPSIPSPTHQPAARSSPQPPSTVEQSPPNQYPTFTGMPPANIVQTFAPIYVQPQTIQGGGEIYSDYVRDPYNLTLPPQMSSMEMGSNSIAVPSAPPPAVESASAVPPNPFVGATSSSKIFQSSNYFGSDTGVIPPGSEMLFGGTRP